MFWFFQLHEESGIVAEKLFKQGVLMFHFDDKPQPWEVCYVNWMVIW